MKISSCLISQNLNRGLTFKLRCKVFNEEGAFQRINLIYDTGAHVTTIRKDFLQELGYKIYTKSKVKTRTVNGFINMEQSSIEKLNIQGIEFHTIKQVNVFNTNNDDLEFHGVIGMDVISKLETLISFQLRKIIISSNPENMNRELNKLDYNILSNVLEKSSVFTAK